MALTRALPSVRDFPCEVLVGHEPDGTIASARNGLAERASGEWLAFLDADDELAPGYLDAMERAAEQAGDGPVLLTPAVRKVINGRPRSVTFYREVPLERANWLIIGTLVRRDLFMRAKGFEDYPHGFEDWSLWYKCHRLGAAVVKVRRAVYIQHVNPESKHRVGWRDRDWQLETHLRVERELAAWVP